MHLAFETLLSRYTLGERKFQKLTIHSVDGFECTLCGVDLSGSTVMKAYLPYCNLSQSKLQNLVLKDGNLGDAKLFSADLSHAVLVGTDLSRADLRYVCLKGANLKSTNLSGVDLQNADLTGADLTNAVLTRANLNQAKLDQVCLKGTNLFRASGVDLQLAICDRTTILPNGHYY